MSCVPQALSLGVSMANYLQALGVPIIAAPTVIGEGPALAVCLVASIALLGALNAFVDCLEREGRTDDAAKLRREMDQMREEIRRIRP